MYHWPDPTRSARVGASIYNRYGCINWRDSQKRCAMRCEVMAAVMLDSGAVVKVCNDANRDRCDSQKKSIVKYGLVGGGSIVLKLLFQFSTNLLLPNRTMPNGTYQAIEPYELSVPSQARTASKQTRWGKGLHHTCKFNICFSSLSLSISLMPRSSCLASYI